MHLEILVEDSSGRALLEQLVPKVIGTHGDPHTWRIIAYRGVGRIPPGMNPGTDPRKRILLDQLPRILKGYGRAQFVDYVIVVADSDRNDCKSFLNELLALERTCTPRPPIMFRIAIEEIEAWYFGDQSALLSAFPKAKRIILDKYQQGSICGTWELLADAIIPGGSKIVKKQGWPLPGTLKHEWAERIGPLMNINANKSPSFGKLRDGLRRISS